ncbi:MAG TPA: glycosyltransferase family 9 protein [Planctomycetota bacterium]
MTSVLLVRLSAMGDLVQGLGAVAALHEVRPDWRLTLVTQATFAPLVAGFPGLARVVTFARRGGLRGVLDLRRELRMERYDVALDLQGNWKAAAVAWLSGARDRVGIAAPHCQEPMSRMLLGRTLPLTGRPHPARTAWELVRCLAPDAPFLAPRLSATAAEIEREAAAIAAIGVDCRRPFGVVVIADPRDPRALLAEVVLRETRRSTVPVLHLMGPSEAATAAADGVPALRHGAAEPRRLIALGELVARADGWVLGPDRGATHVLAAAGASCRAMFGAQDPGLTAPPAATALVHPVPPPCSPCRSSRCTHVAGPVCMDFDCATGRVVVAELPAFGEREPRRG